MNKEENWKRASSCKDKVISDQDELIDFLKRDNLDKTNKIIELSKMLEKSQAENMLAVKILN